MQTQNPPAEPASLWTFFLRHSRIALMSGILLVLFGAMATARIVKEDAPFIPYGVAVVATGYPGAAAADVDRLVTQKIGDKLKNLTGVKKISAVSGQGFSSITIEYHPETDMTRAMAELRSKVDEAKPDLPGELPNDPSVTEVDSSLEPFLRIVLAGPLAPQELRDFAEEWKTEFETVPQIARATVSGGAEREIRVELDPTALETFGITGGEVAAAIRAAHRDTPLGDLELGGEDFSLRIAGRFQTADEVRNLAIRKFGAGAGVATVGDLGQVFETGKSTDLDQKNFLAIPGKKIENAVRLELSRRAGESIFAADAGARELLEKLRPGLPDSVRVEILRESIVDIRKSYGEVLRGGSASILTVLAVIFLFVGMREGLVAAAVIPLSFLATIAVLFFLGKSLNFMTNFSMIMALGILVDTAIVMTEGVHAGIRAGMSGRKAAERAIAEFKSPLISGTLTTLAVFIPLFGLPGVLGKYLSFIPITVAIVLTASLLLSLTLIPALAAAFLGAGAKKSPTKFRRGLDRVQDFLKNFYAKILEKFLAKKILRRSAVALVVAGFVGSFFLPTTFTMFPSSDARIFTAAIKAPAGTPTEVTAELSRDFVKNLLAAPEVRAVEVSADGRTADFSVELLTEEERTARGLRSSVDLIPAVRTDFTKIAAKSGIEPQVSETGMGPPTDAPVAFRVVAAGGDQTSAAVAWTQKLTAALRAEPGTTGVRNNLSLLRGELTAKIDRSRARALGIDPADAASTVTLALRGQTAATVTRGGRDLDIVVRFAGEWRDSLERLTNLPVATTADGGRVTFGQIATVTPAPGLAEISRRDNRIAFSILSELSDPGTLDAGTVISNFLKKTEKMGLPDGITVEPAGETDENAELFAALLSAFLVAILLIFLILVVEFDSFARPVLILATIVFSQMGVNFGLFLTDTPRSLAFIIGSITLAGIVVNDAIIFLDQIGRRRADGLRARSAIVDAGRSRFQPIILTTITTAVGVLPLAWINEFWLGLAYTVLFGLSVASFLTLFITPAIFVEFAEKTDAKKIHKNL